MSITPDTALPQRLIALWRHLGITTAHVAAPMPGDVAGLAAAAPELIAGLVLCVPSRLDPAPFTGLVDRILMIAGEGGLTDGVTARAMTRLRGAERRVLAGYPAPGWADVIADRGNEIAEWMTEFLGRFAADPPLAHPPLAHPPLADPPLAGSPRTDPPQAKSPRAASPRTDPPDAGARDDAVAGITYRIQGTGPALMLLPFFLAPSQWEPIVPALARRFTVVTLGGRHLGGVAALEDRARAPSYRAMVRTLLEHIAPQPGETILDIGSGSGALDRMAARRFPENPLTAVDVNPFLRREAASLATEEGLADAIAFLPGSAEALPFPDASFGCVFSVTVLEECDADQALREAWRVLRPGGRLGVIVRAIDLPQWWNLPLPPELRTRAETPPQSVGPRGVADASLYRRMRAAGFDDLVCAPALVTLDQPEGPIWHYREDHLLSLLSPEETAIWHGLTRAARQDGVLLMAHPMHCAVGVKPASQAGAAAAGREVTGCEVTRREVAGCEVTRQERHGAVELRCNGWELMSSRAHHSEDALAVFVCDLLASAAPAILLGGLGLGYTLRALLDRLPSAGSVAVAELLPDIIAWNRGELAHYAGRPLDDPRVSVACADVADLLRAAVAASLDAILLDIDNGPDAILFPMNAALYEPAGLRLVRRVLRPGGVLAVWSADRSRRFERALQAAGFEWEARDVPARGGADDPLHTIYLACHTGA